MEGCGAIWDRLRGACAAHARVIVSLLALGAAGLALPGCLKAGCVRNSDCEPADWCVETKCVLRPVSASREGGVTQSSDAATDSSVFIELDAGKVQDSGHASEAKDAGVVDASTDAASAT